LLRQRTAKIEVEKRRSAAVQQWKQQQLVIEEQERKRAEDLRKEREEQDRDRREAEEWERERRVPIPCQTCRASGTCQACGGSGIHDAVFLVSAVQTARRDGFLEFGSRTRGCTTCYGCDQGIRGKLQPGSGTCVTCGGARKFCTGLCHVKPSVGRMRGSPSAPSSPMFCRSPKSSAAKSKPEACEICGGSVQPSLSDAQWLWATAEAEEMQEESAG